MLTSNSKLNDMRKLIADNSVSDYVSIHGTNDADKIKLHTDGQISGVTILSMSGDILINGDGDGLIIRNSAETDAGIKFQDKDAIDSQNFELLYNSLSINKNMLNAKYFSNWRSWVYWFKSYK